MKTSIINGSEVSRLSVAIHYANFSRPLQHDQEWCGASFLKGFQRVAIFSVERGSRILKDMRVLIICNDGARKMTVAYLKWG